MRVRRGLLFWGLFLIPLGAIPLLVRAGYLDIDAFADLWRFWPLILIALGVTLLLGRRSLGLVGVAIAALVLGSLAGGAIAGADFGVANIAGCIDTGADGDEVDDSGTFSGPATVSMDLDCGSLELTVAPGADWAVHAVYKGDPPGVTDSASSLRLTTPDGSGNRRQEWTVTAPADQLRAIELDANAAGSTMTLAGAALDRVDVSVNAGSVTLDGTGASLANLDLSVNAGSAAITLDQGSTTGDLSVNAGSIELCVPPSADLRFDVQDQFTFADNLADQGLRQDGEEWTRDGSGTEVISLSVEGNVGSFTLDPEGGCK